MTETVEIENEDKGDNRNVCDNLRQVKPLTGRAEQPELEFHGRGSTSAQGYGLSCVPPAPYVAALTPRTQSVTAWRRGLWTGHTHGPSFSVTGVLIRRD